MNSDIPSPTKNLQSPHAAKRFLVELANLGEQQLDTERFWKRFRDFFPPDAFHYRDSMATALKRSFGGPVPAAVEREFAETYALHHADVATTELKDNSPSTEEQKTLRRSNLLALRDWLREEWTIADPRRKEWRVFGLRQRFHQQTVGSPEQWSEPPPRSGMDYALCYLWRSADKARRCANPDCTIEPYFLVDRRGRRFCSDVCAQPAQRAYKQLWWEQHRTEISNRRKRQYRKTRAER